MPPEPTPTPRPGRVKPIRKIRVDKWSDEGTFKMTAQVRKVPTRSASGKCYMYAFEHGETDIRVNVDGVERPVRLTFMLYVKIPAAERRASLAEDARRAELAGEPKLF